MPDPSVARFAYRAFISYSHRDKAWADWLHKALETYRVASRRVGTTTAHGKIPRRLNPVFRDRDELSSAPEPGAKINAALVQSENLIVICSPAPAAPGSLVDTMVHEVECAFGDQGACTALVNDGPGTVQTDALGDPCVQKICEPYPTRGFIAFGTFAVATRGHRR